MNKIPVGPGYVVSKASVVLVAASLVKDIGFEPSILIRDSSGEAVGRVLFVRTNATIEVHFCHVNINGSPWQVDKGYDQPNLGGVHYTRQFKPGVYSSKILAERIVSHISGVVDHVFCGNDKLGPKPLTSPQFKVLAEMYTYSDASAEASKYGYFKKKKTVQLFSHYHPYPKAYPKEEPKRPDTVIDFM